MILGAGMERLAMILLCALAFPALGQGDMPSAGTAPEAQTSQVQSPETLHARASDLRAEATRQRQAGEAAYAAAQTNCWQKFFVTACLEDAKRVWREVRRAVRAMEIEAGRLDRHAVKLEREARLRRHAEEAPQRKAEAARRAEDMRRRQEEALRRMEDRPAPMNPAPSVAM